MGPESFSNSPAGLAILITFVVVVVVRISSSSRKNKPPGPPGWPILGNILELGELPHQTMHKLKAKYGPLLWLQLGSINTMVIQNAGAAETLFKKYDATFCDRKAPHVLTALDFDKGSIAMNNYGGKWRLLRRLCSMELMAHKQMNRTSEARRRIIDNMVEWIHEDSVASRGAVEIRNFLFLMTFNVIGNLMLSRDLLDPKDPQGNEFYEALSEIIEIAGTPNIADFIPLLKWLDPLGRKRQMIKSMKRTMQVSSKYVQERIEKRKAGEFLEKKDFLDTLLDYEGDGKDDAPSRLTEKDINILVMELCLAGTDTSVISIEWGLAELLRNPHTFEKLRDEIDKVVGMERKVEESDMENLPYLMAVVKETYRLHPAIPFLFPRHAMEDTNFMGYHIPKGTQVFVSAWAIGRDPELWEDPMTFKPERFLINSDSNHVEYKGQHFGLIPFGSGRRICIGLPLAHRVVPLALAALVQAFDWDLGSGVNPKGIDVEEALGMTLRKKNPLKLITKRRLVL